MPKAGVVLSVYVSSGDAALLSARASSGDRTVSAELRRILRPLHTMSEGPARQAPALVTASMMAWGANAVAPGADRMND